MEKEIRPRLNEEEYAVIQNFRNTREVPMPKPQAPPSILLFDIETAPLKAYLWSMWQQGVSLEMTDGGWYVLCWAARWLFSDEVMSDVVTPREVKIENDKRVVASVWDLIDKADILVGHNIDKFDLKRLRWRWLIHEMKPPMPFRTVDTLKVAKKEFDPPSRKLDGINKFLGKTRKIKTDAQLWIDCIEGDKQALRDIEEYCRGDVFALEDTYLAFRPWIHSHPNIGLYRELDEPVCSNCGGTDIKWKGYYYTDISKFRAGRCECGAIVRLRQNEYPKEKRKNLAIGTAR